MSLNYSVLLINRFEMQISSLFVCLLLVCHYMSVHSYDRHYNQRQINDCTNQVHCSDNKGLPSHPQTQQLIDCMKPNNCQTNTLKSKRQQPNDCHNQIDCQEDHTYQWQSSHQRKAHRNRANLLSRQINEEPSPQLISMTALQEDRSLSGVPSRSSSNLYVMIW